jgi:hypothetical protein
MRLSNAPFKQSVTSDVQIGSNAQYPNNVAQFDEQLAPIGLISKARHGVVSCVVDVCSRDREMQTALGVPLQGTETCTSLLKT